MLDPLAEGMSEAAIMAEYPTLTVEGIRALAAYGASASLVKLPATAVSFYFVAAS